MDKTSLQRYDEYVARAKAHGASTRRFRTPCCGQELEGCVPQPHERQWDSLVICPHCGAHFMKIARHDSISGFVPDQQGGTNA